jgi:hypothetical protein
MTVDRSVFAYIYIQQEYGIVKRKLAYHLQRLTASIVCVRSVPIFYKFVGGFRSVSNDESYWTPQSRIWMVIWLNVFRVEFTFRKLLGCINLTESMHVVL